MLELVGLRPDVASVVVGINDTLRSNFDPQRTGAAVAASGVTAIAATPNDAYISTRKQSHGERPGPCPRGPLPKTATIIDRMSRKLHTQAGAAVYAARKAIVEPVIGQIKQARGFRQFLLRGFEKVQGEWSLVCTTHNILKLYRLCR